MATRNVNINTNVVGADQVEKLKRQLADTAQVSRDTTAGLSKIGEALAAKTVPEMTAYTELWKKSADAAKAFQGVAKNAIESVAATVKRQQDLSKFYGTSIFTTSMINLNSAARNFVSQGGKGFSTWLQAGVGQLAQFRMALAAAGAAFVAFGAAAALNSKQALYAIDSYMESMSHRIGDKGATRAWIESAQKTDWSVGRTGRAAILDSLMTMPNFQISAAEGQRVAEDIEKYWFANQERLKAWGVTSAEDLSRRLASGSFSQEENIALFGKYGLAMSKAAAPGRMKMMSDLASDIDIDAEMEKRPEAVLRHRLSKLTAGTGDMMIGPLNKVLGLVLKLGEAFGKIPGADKFVGWGLMFGTAATGALLLVSAVGGMIPLLLNGIRVLHLSAIASKAYAVAMNLGAAASKLFSAALISTGVGALLVLAGTLIAVAYKTGALQKAWDRFKGSAIGKDFAAGLEWAAREAEKLFGWISKLFDRIDKAYETGAFKYVGMAALGPAAAPLALAKALGGESEKTDTGEETAPRANWLKTGFAVALGPITAPLMVLGKVIPEIGERVRRLVEGSETLQKLARFGNTIFVRIKEFIEKLVSIFSAAKDLIQGVLDALPGAEKRKAISDLKEEAAKYGLEYKDGKFYGMTGGGTAGNVTDEYVAKHYDAVAKAFGTSAWHDEMAKVGLTYGQQNPTGYYQLGTGGARGELGEGEVPADLWAEHLATQAMPGFWGEILAALTDLPSKLAAAIVGALQRAAPQIFGTAPMDPTDPEFRSKWEALMNMPGMAPEALDELFRYASGEDMGWGNVHTPYGEPTLTAAREIYEDLLKGTPPITTQIGESAKGAADVVTDKETYTGPPTTTGELVAQTGASIVLGPAWYAGKGLEAGRNLFEAGRNLYKNWRGSAVGGPVLSTGLELIHEGEDIAPADVVRGGETVLEKIVRHSQAGFGGGGGDTYISANVSLSDVRIDSDMDVRRIVYQMKDELLFAMRSDLEHIGARSAGNLRGGSIK